MDARADGCACRWMRVPMDARAEGCVCVSAGSLHRFGRLGPHGVTTRHATSTPPSNASMSVSRRSLRCVWCVWCVWKPPVPTWRRRRGAYRLTAPGPSVAAPQIPPENFEYMQLLRYTPCAHAGANDCQFYRRHHDTIPELASMQPGPRVYVRTRAAPSRARLRVACTHPTARHTATGRRRIHRCTPATPLANMAVRPERNRMCCSALVRLLSGDDGRRFAHARAAARVSSRGCCVMGRSLACLGVRRPPHLPTAVCTRAAQ